MKMKCLMLVICVLAGATCAARAADTEADLKVRFEQRYPHLVELKAAGIIGETTAGYVDFVKGAGDPGAQKFVAAENADRTALYKLLAAKDGTAPDKVAELNARRRFEKAKPGEWLKGADGQWKQKG
jgi:uncharacterized protein YdbL (DUF1318 family)